MNRPSEITRERVMKAAERLIAEHGYESTSIRAIVAKARVNQAAINYHFAGKEGLYREILRAAFRALTAHQLAHAEEGEDRHARSGTRRLRPPPATAALRATNSAGICGFSIGKPRNRPQSFASS